ncbi:MAG TPA: ABC transporter permease [Verrucomicrobiae bacterium]|jgi:peptide/nickel transport system permease protein|nr:ABC transporter permease [Verrucomicrobiae bacterium]
MTVYALQRLVGLVPVLFGISVVIFLTMKLIPGDVARALLGPMATDQSLAQLRHALGLDEAIHVQYAKWLWRAVHGDLGLSPIVHKPVMELLLPKFGNTLILASASFALAVVGGITVGLVAAARPQTAVDRTAMGVSLVVGNMPPFWLGLVLIVLFAIDLRWLPSLGMYSSRGPGGLDDLLLHLIMPAVATAAAPGAIIARMTRASLLEILGQDYIKVARSKGLSERAVLWLHALRVAWPPILTIAGLQLGYLLGGAVFTEEVFGWPGLGRQLVSSVIARDVQVVQGAALFIAVMFVLVNLVVDLLNLYLDPRTRPA